MGMTYDRLNSEWARFITRNDQECGRIINDLAWYALWQNAQEMGTTYSFVQ